eukprot:TRINITY_DN8635_c1_g1_i1.p1 TRINITY_DN8635_c1_g1~~TRINITY_DN8635_c1_g1_i1.p1  ORF type:complete len:604 (-),score=63.01 TRINITY_DN8635_c1_g1_i1:107-1918(-)
MKAPNCLSNLFIIFLCRLCSVSAVLQVDTFKEAGTVSTDLYGHSVSMSGTIAVVGSPGKQSATGEAYIYEQSFGSWGRTAILKASDAAVGDRFGSSVKASGDRVIIGAYDDDGWTGVQSGTGAVYIYNKTGNVWGNEVKIIGNDSLAADNFGMSVSIDGNTAVVGADWHNSGKGAGSGGVYVFNWNGSSWVQEAKLVANDSQSFSRFGASVDVSGDTVIVGAYNDNVDQTNIGSGSAYVFRKVGNSWIQEWKFTGGVNASQNDRFGYSVAVSGDWAVVGSYWDDEGALDAGAAHLWMRNSTHGWMEINKIYAPSPQEANRFGISVDISGNLLIIGEEFDSDDGTYSGSAYVYAELENRVWTLKQKISAENATSSEFFGRSVSIHDSVVGPFSCMVGAPGANSTMMFDGSIPTTTTLTSTTSTTTTTTTTITYTTTTTSTTSYTTTTTTSTSSSTATTTSSTSTSVTVTTTSSTSSTATTTSSTSSTVTSTQTTSTSSTLTKTSSTSSTMTSTSSTSSTLTTTSSTATATTTTSTTTTYSTFTITDSGGEIIIVDPGNKTVRDFLEKTTTPRSNEAPELNFAHRGHKSHVVAQVLLLTILLIFI